MSLSSEVWLLLGVVGFYLYDSLRLANIHEVYLLKGVLGWQLKLPSNFFKFRGQCIFLPNPLTPWNPIFSSNFFDEIGSQDFIDLPSQLSNSLLVIRLLVVTLFIEMLVFLPISIYFFGMGMTTLGIVLSIYITVVILVITLFRKKIEFKLTPKKYLSLAFDCIACPPFALNVVRKLSLATPINLNLFEFVQKMLTPNRREEFFIQLHKRAEDMILASDEGSIEYQRLQELKKRLSGLLNEFQ
jgi:hypothetical protein